MITFERYLSVRETTNEAETVRGIKLFTNELGFLLHVLGKLVDVTPTVDQAEAAVDRIRRTRDALRRSTVFSQLFKSQRPQLTHDVGANDFKSGLAWLSVCFHELESLANRENAAEQDALDAVNQERGIRYYLAELQKYLSELKP